MNYVEYPIALARNGEIKFPKIELLETKGIAFGHTYTGTLMSFLSANTGYDVRTVQDWMKDYIDNRCEILGCYGFEKKRFFVKREFPGIVVYFKDADAAVHFRMAWAGRYSYSWPIAACDG